jgi:serine/threonine protein kinase
MRSKFPKPIVHGDLKLGEWAPSVASARNAVLQLSYLFPLSALPTQPPANVFLADDGTVAVGDLGRAGTAHGSQSASFNGNTVGTLHYSAPETFDEGARRVESDVWSFGMLAYELVTGRMPFSSLLGPDATPAQFVKALLVDRARPPLEDLEEAGSPPELVRIIQRCWRERPEDRPSFQQIKAQLSFLCSELVLGVFCSPADEDYSLKLLPECRALDHEWGGSSEGGTAGDSRAHDQRKSSRIQLLMNGNVAELRSLLKQSQHRPVRILHLAMHGEGDGLAFIGPWSYGHETEHVDDMELAQYIKPYARCVPTHLPPQLVVRQGANTELEAAPGSKEEAVSGSIECVVINACLSVPVAQRLIDHGLR